VSSDKTIDALYAFSDCEINISPNCCVIEDNKPCFLTISDVLRHNVDYTMGLLRKELMIRKNELEEQLFFSSLEKIFIEERIYKDKKFENAENMDAAIEHVDNRLEPYKKNFIREITRDDILRLMEIKMQRILKFNKDKADELIARIKDEIKGINHDLAHMVEVTINWFTFIKNKYGANFPRRTEIRNFDTIEATKVVEANEKLYINRAEGFIGTGLKKDEFVCNCSDIDDIIIFYKDGKYKVIRVADKIFVGKNILHVQVFKKNDTRTIYNVAYRDGRQGYTYMKRFNVTAITRDKEYDLTQGKPGSKILYFTSNPNGEAETIKVTLDSSPTLKTIFLNRDFSQISIRGKSSRGYLLSKKPVHRISLKDRGHSTLGGLKVWYDPDVNRLNYDEHGTFLGEFNDDEKILIVLDNNDFYLTSFDVNNHFENNIKIIEKWNPNKIWTAVLFDADNQGYPYIKRFTMEALKKKQNFVGENPNSKLVILTDQVYPRIKVNFGGLDAYREPMEIDVEEFIMVKGFKAKGKRITTCHIDSIEELEPTKFPEPVEDEDNSEEDTASEEEVSEDKDSSNTTSSQDQVTKQGNPSEQLSLFPDEDS
ncbi:MAG: DNA gyrase/topoisomerase IV subunit A, partial [Prevotella sp.]|nr:DNA gyrase/topoisomerase IV subunit A [Prevotella sp.]